MSAALKLALGGVLLLSVALLPAPLWMFGQSESPGRWVLVAFAALVAENVWTMFFRVRKAGLPKPIPNVSMAFVGYGYAAVFWVSLLDFHGRGAPLPGAAFWIPGVVLLVAGKALHYWSTHHLRRHAGSGGGESTPGPRSLIRSGPYAAIRHPMYTAACLEAAGLPLALASPWGLAVALLVFIPLEYHRAVLEERVLDHAFGQDYKRYTASTARLFGWPFRSGRNGENA